ncbi:hypothetical protein HWV62_12308 [Athelia sp. TMB]|nr:hypothetical protein HWV62_12308 [Athelia sp. TMB]
MVVFSACVLVYDYFLTFDSEVTLIWGEPWKTLKILFLLSRYLPFVDTVLVFLDHFLLSSQNGCSALSTAEGLMFAIGSCITEYIFAVRTWAMWGFDRKVGVCLLVLYIGTWLPDIVITILFGRSIEYLPPNPVAHGCNEASGNVTIVFAQSGVLIAYWITLIGFMVAKGGSPLKPLFKEGLFNILYRDGLVVLNMIAITWPRVMHSVLTNHLLFHIRRYGRQTVQWDGNDVFTPAMESLVFEHELETWSPRERPEATSNA